jgi:hypothetical protein
MGNSLQASTAAAPEQIEEKGLYLIVGVVGGDQLVCPEVLAGLGQCLVPCLSSIVLDRLPPLMRDINP